MTTRMIDEVFTNCTTEAGLPMVISSVIGFCTKNYGKGSKNPFIARGRFSRKTRCDLAIYIGVKSPLGKAKLPKFKVIFSVRR